jgi:hypothetical protein
MHQIATIQVHFLYLISLLSYGDRIQDIPYIIHTCLPTLRERMVYWHLRKAQQEFERKSQQTNKQTNNQISKEVD